MVGNVTGKIKLGASGTDVSGLGKLGALQQYIDMGKSIIPPREKKDPWLTAFQFFTNMAAEASKPGSTAIGAAGAAGSNVVASLLEERKQKRAEDIAGAGLGIKLATALSKPKTFKQYPTGGTASYMSAVDAEKYLIDKGLAKTSPNFKAVVERLTAPTDSMIGKPVVFADSFQMMTPVVKGNEIIDFNFTPVTGGAKPGNVEYRQKRLPILAKNQDYISKSFNVLPQVQRGMDLLLTGDVTTGGLTEFTMPLRNTLGQLFGVTDPELQNLQIIQSISNVLAPKMRPVGSGSTSDMEFKAYQRSIADLGNTPKSNYLSLYTFKKVQENSNKAAQRELEILTSGGSAKDVREELEKIDKGIYETYKGPLEEDKVREWYNSLPKGAVIYNRASDGSKLIDDGNIFEIKGWGE
tara:strand:+ start:5263 stop:6492 length:1230 start_codon:yes stop_codon:yes gene_type:complete